jgi:FtsP/CotA-like multicopper oxidase with cupredoxin domain
MRLLCVLLSTLPLYSFSSTSLSGFQPKILTSKNGRLDVTLDVVLSTSLDGRRVSPSFNGDPIGPTLRVKPGDTLTVTLNNKLPPGSDLDRELYEYTHDSKNEISDFVNLTKIFNRLDEFGNGGTNPTFGYWGLNYVNIHFHGKYQITTGEFPLIILNQTSFSQLISYFHQGTNFDPKIEHLHDALDGGESEKFIFKIPKNHKTGLFWYHSHFHGTTVKSYMSGLMGFFVIEGTKNDITKAKGIKGAKEVFLMLSEFLPSPGTKFPPPSFPIVFEFDWVAVTNGYDSIATNFLFDAGDLVLFRVNSATVEPTIIISIDDHTMIPVAMDGFPLPVLEEVNTVSLGGGQRIEFLVRFEKPGTFVMRRAPWATGNNVTGIEMCNMIFGVPVEHCISYDVPRIIATIEVAPAAIKTQKSKDLLNTIKLPKVDKEYSKLARKKAVAKKTILLQFDNTYPLFQVPYDGPFVPPGFAFGINNKLFTPFQSLGTVQSKTCETWDVISDPPNFQHSFHVHVSDFLVTHVDGMKLDNPFWGDTVVVYGFNITIHICFDHVVAGDQLLIHCHMPSHQDIGYV